MGLWPERLPHPARIRVEQLLLVGTSVTLAVLGAGMSPPYVFADLVDALPWLWEAIFALTSVACLWWAVRPWSFAAYATSSVLLPTAAASRLVALVLLTDRVQWPPVAGWALVMLLSWGLWPRMWADLGDTGRARVR